MGGTLTGAGWEMTGFQVDVSYTVKLFRDLIIWFKIAFNIPMIVKKNIACSGVSEADYSDFAPPYMLQHRQNIENYFGKILKTILP